jgi:hypothetical protein
MSITGSVSSSSQNITNTDIAQASYDAFSTELYLVETTVNKHGVSIASNTAAIEANTINITANSNAIDEAGILILQNETDIASNSTNISSNVANITSNTANITITSNASAITAIQTVDTTQNTNIINNTIAITAIQTIQTVNTTQNTTSIAAILQVLNIKRHFNAVTEAMRRLSFYHVLGLNFYSTDSRFNGGNTSILSNYIEISVITQRKQDYFYEQLVVEATYSY